MPDTPAPRRVRAPAAPLATAACAHGGLPAVRGASACTHCGEPAALRLSATTLDGVLLHTLHVCPACAAPFLAAGLEPTSLPPRRS